jgi:DegV family protein with EDD domain
MRNSIALVTDSTCDIPSDLLEKYEIIVVPQVILWGGQTLRDRVDLQPEAFYRRLMTDRQHPTTSQPAIQDFVQAYRKGVERGAQEILVVTVSGAMSGTCQIAQTAAQEVGTPVHVIDPKGPTMSLGWQVLAAARVRAVGGDAQAMIEKMNQVRRKLVQFVCLDTLEYLHRGGRIGGAAWLAGMLLNIKPLLYIDHGTGLVEASDRVRTRRKSVELLYERFFERIDTGKVLRVAVLHGDAPDEARALVERIQREISPAELLVNVTGPVLGIHTGPRALALCGYTED